MKRVTLTLTFECRDDITEELVNLIRGNVAEHVEHEFGSDWSDWGEDQFGGREPLSGPVLSSIEVDGRAIPEWSLFDERDARYARQLVADAMEKVRDAERAK